jgi:hypothetical protein
MCGQKPTNEQATKKPSGRDQKTFMIWLDVVSRKLTYDLAVLPCFWQLYPPQSITLRGGRANLVSR